jgi:hypothetical protein
MMHPPVFRMLAIGNCLLSGSVPSFLTTMTNLQSVDLFYNVFSGTLPASLFAVSSLTYLDLSWNGSPVDGALEGTLPSIVSSLSNLQVLNLQMNGMPGTLPASLSSLAQLSMLLLGDNTFTGTIPSVLLSRLSKLVVLQLGSRLSECGLTGTIPSTLSRLRSLRYARILRQLLLAPVLSWLESEPPFFRAVFFSHLDLRSCALTGSLPSTLSSLSRLLYLDVRENQLSGFVPAQLSVLPTGLSGSLCNNLFSGEAGVWMTRFTQLK